MSKLVLVSIRDDTCVNLNVLTEWLTNTSLRVWLQVRALESRCHHQHLLLSIVLLAVWLLLLVHLPSCKHNVLIAVLSTLDLPPSLRYVLLLIESAELRLWQLELIDGVCWHFVAILEGLMMVDAYVVPVGQPTHVEHARIVPTGIRNTTNSPTDSHAVD